MNQIRFIRELSKQLVLTDTNTLDAGLLLLMLEEGSLNTKTVLLDYLLRWEEWTGESMTECYTYQILRNLCKEQES